MAASLPFAGVVFAAESERRYGDDEYGRGLAVRWCGSCHQVTADHPLRPMPGGPTVRQDCSKQRRHWRQPSTFIEISPSKDGQVRTQHCNLG